VLVAGVAIVVYLNTLSADFVWDDRFQIVQNPAIKDLRFVPRFFTTGVWTLISPTHPTNYYRPMMFVSFLITYHLFGLDPVGFHLMNVAINALVALMVYALTFRLLRRGDIALIAGLLFAVHPIHTEAVAWVASRGGYAKAFLSAPAISSSAALAFPCRRVIRMKPWKIPSYRVSVTGTPASRRRAAYASPSSRSGSHPAVITSAGGRPARLGASSGEAYGSFPCSSRAR